MCPDFTVLKFGVWRSCIQHWEGGYSLVEEEMLPGNQKKSREKVVQTRRVTPQLVARFSASNDSSCAFLAGIILRPYSYASSLPLQSNEAYDKRIGMDERRK